MQGYRSLFNTALFTIKENVCYRINRLLRGVLLKLFALGRPDDMLTWVFMVPAALLTGRQAGRHCVL